MLTSIEIGIALPWSMRPCRWMCRCHWRRKDVLAEKNQEGKLTDAERVEYDTYIFAIDFLTVLQAKARSILKSRVKN